MLMVFWEQRITSRMVDGQLQSGILPPGKCYKHQTSNTTNCCSGTCMNFELSPRIEEGELAVLNYIL
uniref:Uncharacterized protein n=2 Tax=Musa acuminata subsp. malaccensis TaxID=214687 RepID=A0A804JFV9_MUSAM